MLDQHVYWTDGLNNSISRFLKGNAMQREQLISGIPNIGHMIIVSRKELTEKGESPQIPRISPLTPECLTFT